MERLKKMAPDGANLAFLSDKERTLFTCPESCEKQISDEYERSAIEMVANMAVSRGILKDRRVISRFFVPKRFEK